MKKMIIAVAILMSAGAMAGQIGLPKEHLALPALQGEHLVCIWDQTANSWYTDFATYDHKGSLDFQVPAWGRWYWIGLWDSTKSEYVFGKWIGHFLPSE